MATGPAGDSQGSSTRPYLLRALHDWCTDNGFTPYIAVHVDASVQVPPEYVKNDEIVLNIGFEATSSLKLGNQFIEFRARFGGVAREIVVPVDHVVAIYARENGQGMAFPMPAAGGTPAAPAPAGRGQAPRSVGRAAAGAGAAGASTAQGVGARAGSPRALRLARQGTGAAAGNGTSTDGPANGASAPTSTPIGADAALGAPPESPASPTGPAPAGAPPQPGQPPEPTPPRPSLKRVK